MTKHVNCVLLHMLRTIKSVYKYSVYTKIYASYSSKLFSHVSKRTQTKHESVLLPQTLGHTCVHKPKHMFMFIKFTGHVRSDIYIYIYIYVLVCCSFRVCYIYVYVNTQNT